MTPFILCFGKMKPRKFYSKIVRNFFARWKKSWCDMCRKWLYNYFLLSWLFLASTHRHISKHKKTEGKDHQTSQRNKNDNRDIRSQPVSFYSVEFFRLLFFSVFFSFLLLLFFRLHFAYFSFSFNNDKMNLKYVVSIFYFLLLLFK